jgi:hypothetical protein
LYVHHGFEYLTTTFTNTEGLNWDESAARRQLIYINWGKEFLYFKNKDQKSPEVEIQKLGIQDSNSVGASSLKDPRGK